MFVYSHYFAHLPDSSFPEGLNLKCALLTPIFLCFLRTNGGIWASVLVGKVRGKDYGIQKQRSTQMLQVPWLCPTHKLPVQLFLLQLMPQQIPSWTMLQRMHWMGKVLQGLSTLSFWPSLSLKLCLNCSLVFEDWEGNVSVIVQILMPGHFYPFSSFARWGGNEKRVLTFRFKNM